MIKSEPVLPVDRIVNFPRDSIEMALPLLLTHVLWLSLGAVSWPILSARKIAKLCRTRRAKVRVNSNADGAK